MTRKHSTLLRKRMAHLKKHASLSMVLRAYQARKMFKRILPL